MIKASVPPAGHAVGADRDQAAVRGGFAANIQHDAAVRELNGKGLARVHDRIVIDGVPMAADHVPTLPRVAVIIAVDDTDNGRTVTAMFTYFRAAAVRHPDGDDHTAIAQPRTVPRTRRNDLPGVVVPVPLEHCGDIDRFAEGDAVVVAVHTEGAGVIVAENSNDVPRGYARDHDEVANGSIAVERMVYDFYNRPKRDAAVRTASHQDVVKIVVAALPRARFCGDQHRIVSRHHHAGDAVDPIPIFTGFKLYQY